MNPSHQEKFETHKACVLVATYNNAGSLEDILRRVLSFTNHLIVVNDGSTDDSLEILLALQKETSFHLHSYDENIGKGHALRTGFSEARKLSYDYALTIDSDGQHFPEDIPLFFDKLEEVGRPCLILGNRNMNTNEGIPSSSSFGNNFSNFWFWVETGQKLPDTQTGFRLYPIKLYDGLKFKTYKFEFEIEVLVRSAWRGVHLDSVPVQIVYFTGDERVSHFRPFTDFSRISLLNTVLVTLAIVWFYPRQFIRYFIQNKPLDIIKEQLSKHNETKLKVSLTMGFGFFMGIVPIWGFQMITAFFLSQWLKLNKTLVILAANISLPPLVPFIIWASFYMGGLLLHGGNNQKMMESIDKNIELFQTESFFTALMGLGSDLLQYIVGSFALAILVGIVGFLTTYVLISLKEKVWKSS